MIFGKMRKMSFFLKNQKKIYHKQNSSIWCFFQVG